jgi:hypothetical protein
MKIIEDLQNLAYELQEDGETKEAGLKLQMGVFLSSRVATIVNENYPEMTASERTLLVAVIVSGMVGR